MSKDGKSLIDSSDGRLAEILGKASKEHVDVATKEPVGTQTMVTVDKELTPMDRLRELWDDPSLRMDTNRGEACAALAKSLTETEFRELTNQVIDLLFPPDQPPLIDRIKLRLFLEAVNFDRDVIAIIFHNKDGSLMREVTSFPLPQLAIAAKKKIGV